MPDLNTKGGTTPVSQRHATIADVASGRLTVDEAAARHRVSAQVIHGWADEFLSSASSQLDADLRELFERRGLARGQTASELAGNVEDVSIPELVQLLVSNGRTGQLVLSNAFGEHRLWIDGGRVMTASSGALVGTPAVLRILAQSQGRFVVTFGSAAPPEPNVSEEPHVLLLRAAHRNQEAQRLLDRLPPASEVLIGPRGSPSLVLSVEQSDLLARLADGATIDELLRDSPHGHAETVTALRELYGHGYLRETGQHRPLLDPRPDASPVETRELLSELNPPPPARRVGTTLALGFFAGLGAAVVFALAWRAFDRTPAPDEPIPSPASLPSRPSASPLAADGVSPRCPAGMAGIAGRRFRLGTEHSGGPDNLAVPAHDVEVTSFCLDRTEVTHGTYERCVAEGICSAPRSTNGVPPPGLPANMSCRGDVNGEADHPVTCVTWDQADVFCHWAGKRLPSEAEWELAAKGSPSRPFPWGDEPVTIKRANVCDDSCAREPRSSDTSASSGRLAAATEPSGPRLTGDDGWPASSPVKSFPDGATPTGVFDLAGNVAEWTADFVYRYAGGPVRHNPRGPIDGTDRVVRGGSFASRHAGELKTTSRATQDGHHATPTIGFRCAASPLGTGSDRVPNAAAQDSPPDR
ncbi:MAG: DUF4388 domain-containing protein [Myxococcales bacterium FL481]|nr:MAG: DUF4388 domain-containing protein [Myxococcales bacterium FL481]